MGEVKTINYRGIDFTVERGFSLGTLKLMSPDGTMGLYGDKDSFSASGLITRFNNYIDSFNGRIDQANAAIAAAEKENSELKPRLNDPFEQADLLKAMQARHDSVKRKLMKSTQLEAVPEGQRNKFNSLLEQRKQELIKLGYEDALNKAEKQDDDTPMFSRGASNSAPIFYSALSNAIGEIKTNKAPSAIWKGMVKNLTQKGVKPDEIEWTGINEWLDLQTGSVTKEQVLDYLNANGVQVEETMLESSSMTKPMIDKLKEKYGIEADFEYGEYSFTNEDGDDLEYYDLPQGARDIADDLARFGETQDGTKYSKYTVPGGENYKELLLTLPEINLQSYEDKKQTEFNALANAYAKSKSLQNYQVISDVQSALKGEPNKALSVIESLEKFYGTNEGKKYFTAALQAKADYETQFENRKNKSYRSSHFEQSNILAHVRFDERTDADGNKVLFIQEVQSDFGQDYKKAKDSISKAVDDDFEGIINRMKAAGVLEVNCD
jgi:hypothetical protein